MTIHTDHPFVPDEGDRDPLRRLRGRLAAPVTVWTTGSGRGRAGLTVSSLLVADGDPARVLGLVDEDSDLADALDGTGLLTVNVLGTDHRFLAEVFAGLAPAPGGPFTQGEWQDGPWGPRLADAVGHLGVRVDPAPRRHAGWALLVEGTIEDVHVGAGDPLVHLRGRYRT